MEEYLTKIIHDLEFAREGLQEAGRQATSTEHIIIMSLIEKVAVLQNDTNALLNAHITDFLDNSS